MGFWKLDDSPTRVAVADVHAGLEKTYGELREDVARAASAMTGADGKALIMLAAKNRYDSLVLYLAALSSGQALMLGDANLSRDLLLPLLETYRPDYVYGGFDSLPGYR